MNRKIAHICLLILMAISSQVCSAREPKEYDSDVNYKEARLPSYDLPPLLLTAEGKKITTADEWRNIRRPQILSLFSLYSFPTMRRSPFRAL